MQIFFNITAVQASCEGIDVEDGEYRFFNAEGDPLEIVFLKPNKKSKTLFGLITVVQSGIFDLVHTNNPLSTTLLQALTDNISLAPNPYYTSIEEVRKLLLSAKRNIH